MRARANKHRNIIHHADADDYMKITNLKTDMIQSTNPNKKYQKQLENKHYLANDTSVRRKKMPQIQS